MPHNLTGAPFAASTAGVLAGSEDGVAFGWAMPEGCSMPFVVIRLDGVPVGAGTCLATSEPGDADANRHRFRIDLDHGRLAHGGTLTAERIGTASVPLDGTVRIEADAPLVEPAGLPDLSFDPGLSFDKEPGLTISGWIAAADRGCPPPLRLAVNDEVVAEPILAGRLAADAWRAGGSLASGYAVTIPIAVEQPLPAAVRLTEAATGRLLWQGSVDAHDCLVADMRALIASGTDRNGMAGGAVADRIVTGFRACVVDRQGDEPVSSTLALDLVDWLAGSGRPAEALDLLLLLDPQSAMQGRSARFLDTVATLLCSLPSAELARIAIWLDLPQDAPARSRLLDYLAALAETRLNGLGDGGARLFHALSGMGYGQAAINWAWEAMAASPTGSAALRTFRRTLEMQIAAQNVPFSAGFEFVAKDAR